MAMVKLGQSYDQKYGGDVPTKSTKNKMSYPYLSLDNVKPSGLKVGDTVIAKVKLRLTRCSENEDDNGTRCSSSFDVLAIDLPNKSQDGVEYAVNSERNRRKQ